MKMIRKCYGNFLSHYMSLSTAKFVKNCHIWAKSYFSFLKNVLKQTWIAFNTKFWNQWKYQNSSYQLRNIFACVCNLIVLSLGWNSVKVLRVTKVVKKIKFEGIWGELEAKKGFQRQSFTQYLRLTLLFMWNISLWEKFNCYFSEDFC